MTEKDGGTPTAEDMYVGLEAALFERDLSNSEHYDKSILMYATGGLALSLTFIKDIVPLKEAISLGLLEASWVFWICSIFSVLASYVLGLEASNRQRDLADRYYRRNDDAAFKEENPYIKWVKWTNLASGLLFVLGATLTMAFVWANVEHKAKPTPTTENANMVTPTPTPTLSDSRYAEDGTPPPSIKKKIAPTPAPSAPSPPPTETPKQ